MVATFRVVQDWTAHDFYRLLGSVTRLFRLTDAAMRATGKAFPGRSRPLCPYPKHAHYKGQGDTEDTNNFKCR